MSFPPGPSQLIVSLRLNKPITTYPLMDVKERDIIWALNLSDGRRQSFRMSYCTGMIETDDDNDEEDVKILFTLIQFS